MSTQSGLRPQKEKIMETKEQLEALTNLPTDVVIMKLENETIQALATAHPRDHEKIRNELAKQIEAYPSFAKSAIYCKPVGKDNKGNQKYARGLSIRAAEAIAEAYGYCRIRSDVTPIDETTVKVEATFTDYQKGRIWQDGGILSKFYKNRYGKMTRIPDDRFYNVTVKAEASKRIREVICRSVPPGLRSELTDMVEEKIDTLLDDSTIDKMIANFANKGITDNHLEKLVGRTRKAGWTKEDRRNLIGIWNSLEQDETTVNEIIAQFEENETIKPSNNSGPVSPDDFKEKGKSGKSRNDPEPVEPELRDEETNEKIEEQKQKLQTAGTPKTNLF